MVYSVHYPRCCKIKIIKYQWLKYKHIIFLFLQFICVSFTEASDEIATYSRVGTGYENDDSVSREDGSAYNLPEGITNAQLYVLYYYMLANYGLYLPPPILALLTTTTTTTTTVASEETVSQQLRRRTTTPTTTTIKPFSDPLTNTQYNKLVKLLQISNLFINGILNIPNFLR